jgi:hypothetical protein
MTSIELAALVSSPDFKAELGEVSGHLASIAQERPIIQMIAKRLWGRDLVFSLEDQHQDLRISGRHFEFKFNYDKTLPLVSQEMQDWHDFDDMWERKRNKSWSPMAKVYQDLKFKRPHVFVWIICARDLNHLSDEVLAQRRINMWKEQKKYRGSFPYDPYGPYLEIAKLFLERLSKEVAGFEVPEPVTLQVENKLFRSTYHLYICDLESGLTNPSTLIG